MSFTRKAEPLYILGAGSMGLFLAASLRIAYGSYPVKLLLRPHHHAKLDEDNHVTICLRQEQPTAERPNQIRRTAIGRLSPPRLVRVPAQIIHPENVPQQQHQHHRRHIENVIVTTKADQAVSAIQSIEPLLTPWGEDSSQNLRILLLCNGALAVREELFQACSETLALQQQQSEHHRRILLGWTSQGAYREPPAKNDNEGDAKEDDNDDMFHVVQGGWGPSAVEEWPQLASVLQDAGWPCQSLSSQQIQVDVWRKLAANCVINPLTALYQCTNGSLLLPAYHHEFQTTMKTVLAELSKVAQASLLTGENEELDSSIRTLLSEESLQDMVRQIVQGTANNKSSMLQDMLLIQQGRRRTTEIDYFNGFVVQQGHEHGLECPANEQLWNQVKELTYQYRQGDA